MFLIVINTTSGGTRVRGAGAVPAGGRQLQFAGPPPPAVARRTAWSSTGRRFHSARVTRAGAQGPGRVRRPVSRLRAWCVRDRAHARRGQSTRRAGDAPLIHRTRAPGEYRRFARLSSHEARHAAAHRSPHHCTALQDNLINTRS